MCPNDPSLNLILSFSKRLTVLNTISHTLFHLQSLVVVCLFVLHCVSWAYCCPLLRPLYTIPNIHVDVEEKEDNSSMVQFRATQREADDRTIGKENTFQPSQA